MCLYTTRWLWIMGDLPGYGNKVNAFATSCYRVMLNMKRIDQILNTTVYSITNTVPLIHLVRHRQLRFPGHILRMSKEEPVRRYFSIHLINWQKETWSISYLTDLQRLGIIKEQCKNSKLPHFLMIVVHGETLWSPAPQLMDDNVITQSRKLLCMGMGGSVRRCGNVCGGVCVYGWWYGG